MIWLWCAVVCFLSLDLLSCFYLWVCSFHQIWEDSNFCCFKYFSFSALSSSLKVKVLVTQSCPTLCNPMDCSPPGSCVHGILQARILEWIAIPFSSRSFQPRDWSGVSCIAGRFFTIWDIREAFSFRDSNDRKIKLAGVVFLPLMLSFSTLEVWLHSFFMPSMFLFNTFTLFLSSLYRIW